MDTRLSMALHAVLHIAEADVPITSADLAQRMRADASVIRRTLSGLRQKGYIKSDKGHGGGWQINCDLRDVTLYDVYINVSSPTIFTLGIADKESQCLVERAVNDAIQSALADAERILHERLRNLSLAQLSAEFNAKYRQGHHHAEGCKQA